MARSRRAHQVARTWIDKGQNSQRARVPAARSQIPGERDREIDTDDVEGRFCYTRYPEGRGDLLRATVTRHLTRDGAKVNDGSKK